MDNNPNTSQTPKKSIFRKALDAVLGSDSTHIAEMKRLNEKAEAEGEFNPKTIKENRAYAELLEKESAVKKKKRGDEMLASSSTRDSAKSVINSIISKKGNDKNKKNVEKANEPDATNNVVNGGLKPFKAILVESTNRELKDNIYSIASLISLIRNHKLMQAKGRGAKFKSILTQKGYDFENLLMLLQATFKRITDETISKETIEKWLDDEKLKPINVIYNKALKCDENTPKTQIRRKLIAVNPTMDETANVWLALFELIDALNYWKKHPNTDSAEIMENYGIEAGIPGKIKLGEIFIDKTLGTAPTEEVGGAETEPKQSQPKDNDTPEAKASTGIDILNIRNESTGQLASTIVFLDELKSELNKDAAKSIFAHFTTDRKVMEAIEDAVDGLGEALLDSSIDIGNGERKITKDILSIISEYYEPQDENELKFKIIEIVAILKTKFPQLIS